MIIKDLTDFLATVPSNSPVIFEANGRKLTILRFNRLKKRGYNLMTIEFTERPDNPTDELTEEDLEKITAEELLDQISHLPPDMKIEGDHLLTNHSGGIGCSEFISLEKPCTAVYFKLTPNPDLDPLL